MKDALYSFCAYKNLIITLNYTIDGLEIILFDNFLVQKRKTGEKKKIFQPKLFLLRFHHTIFYLQSKIHCKSEIPVLIKFTLNFNNF